MTTTSDPHYNMCPVHSHFPAPLIPQLSGHWQRLCHNYRVQSVAFTVGEAAGGEGQQRRRVRVSLELRLHGVRVVVVMQQPATLDVLAARIATGWWWSYQRLNRRPSEVE